MMDTIREMLVLQEKMNLKVNPDWKTQNYPFYRAAWIECGELMDYTPWKWWKHQTTDFAQAQLEVVDIWHFGLSMLLLEHPDASAEFLINKIYDGIFYCIPPIELPVIDAAETLAADLLTTHKFSIYKFSNLMVASGLTFAELSKQYIGKNVLNFFRQDHGYKTGEYQKIWNGREDNEHLSEIMESSQTIHSDDIYEKLSERYALAIA
jgi:hypothetical protein